MGGHSKIMAGRGFLWVLAAKLWLVLGGCSCDGKVMAGCGWSWLVA